MLMPSIFGENLLDDFFDYSFGSHKTFDMMNTDIRDTENGYEITMNMPGVRKEDVKAELKDGYLTIQATTNSSRDEKDSNGTYIQMCIRDSPGTNRVSGDPPGGRPLYLRKGIG